MKEITGQEARELIRDGKAGWYAVYANPPIVHDKQYVVTINFKHYLADIDEISVEEDGLLMFGMFGKVKSKWIVEVHNDELADMIRVDAERHPTMDVGADVPTFYTGKG